MEYIYLSISWVIYYLFHSLGASDRLKSYLQRNSISLNHWRITYSLISTIGVLAILLFMATMQGEALWPPNRLIKLVSMILITYGLIVVRLSFKKSSVRQFLTQEDRYEEDARLNITGVYSMVRHPIYSGTILIFVGMFLFIGKLSTIVALGVTLLYLLIAIPLEEKKLILKHGETYLDYKKLVPSIIPRFWQR